MKFLVGTVCCFLIFIWAKEVEAERKSLFGTEAKDGEFPYQVYLQTYLKDVQEYSMCGGSILNAITILTAGHCIYNTTTKIYKDSVYVIAGTNNPHEISWNNDYVIVRVIRIVCHSEYIQYGSNDIAILQLETPLKFSKRIQPVKLPASKIPDYGGLIASGWGANSWSKNGSANSFPLHLQYVSLQPTNLEKCENYAISISDICANPDFHSTTCFGDSGGPAVRKYDHRQYGVISGGHKDCIPGTPNILTSVYYNLNWLKENKFSTAYSYWF